MTNGNSTFFLAKVKFLRRFQQNIDYKIALNCTCKSIRGYSKLRKCMKGSLSIWDAMPFPRARHAGLFSIIRQYFWNWLVKPDAFQGGAKKNPRKRDFCDEKQNTVRVASVALIWTRPKLTIQNCLPRKQITSQHKTEHKHPIKTHEFFSSF